MHWTDAVLRSLDAWTNEKEKKKHVNSLDKHDDVTEMMLWSRSGGFCYCQRQKGLSSGMPIMLMSFEMLRS